MRHFFAHVAGESFRNDDGTDRQAIIARCRVGDWLFLVPEPDNAHDDNAIRVLTESGQQIGYVERGMAARLAGDVERFSAFVAGIGRPERSRAYGVSLLLVDDDDEDEAVVQTYARRVLAEGRAVPEHPALAAGQGTGRGLTDNTVIAAVIGLVVLAALLALAVRFVALP